MASGRTSTSTRGPVCLEQFRPSDRQTLLALYTLPATRTFLGGPLSREEATKRVNSLLAQAHDKSAWANRLAPTGEILGFVGLSPHHDEETLEVSCVLSPVHWGHGYASSAVALALNHAFGPLGMPTVLAETQARNLRCVIDARRTRNEIGAKRCEIRTRPKHLLHYGPRVFCA